MKTLPLAALVLAALLAPGKADAGAATLSSVDVPLHGARAPVTVGQPARFDLVGLHWRGAGKVEFRTRALGGRWGPWRQASPEAGDLPDPGSSESGQTRGWRLGSPWWVGPSDRIRYRTSGSVTALRTFFVRSPEVRVPLRPLAIAGAPSIVPRATWGADESIRRAPPQFADSVRVSIVHHTAGANSYTQSSAAAVVRGIQLYHVQGNGWNDIGYNFLVDRFGTVYEGRYGGIDRNVVGAHAKGFNTGSVGVAVLGTYEDAPITGEAESSLAALLAWRLDLAHVDLLSTLTYLSGGSDRFPAGIPVFLRAVSGHRDTGFTACPGDRLYAELGEIATRATALGLPKLYEPTVTTAGVGLQRFRARLSSPQAWAVTITDAGGARVAGGEGFGAAVDWTWDASLVVGSGYRWRIEAGDARPATGSLGTLAGGTTLAITGAAADPETISPNDDGQADSTTVTYTTTAPATVTVTLLDAEGRQVAELQPPVTQSAGEHVFSFDGLGLPDGAYRLVVTAAGSSSVVAREVTVRLTRTLGRAAVAPAVFTPNADGRGDELKISFQLGAQATVRVRVLRDGKWVATPFAGLLAPGPQLIRWDGAKRVGVTRDGTYAALVEATDAVGTTTVALPFVTDARPPVLRLLAGAPPRLWVSEPAALVVRVNGSVRRLGASRAGSLPLAGIQQVRSLVVVARDPAGNRATLRCRRAGRCAQ